MKTIEAWKSEKNTPDWLFAATKTAQRWGAGKELDEATYDAAVEGTGNLKLHAYAPPPAAAKPLVPDAPAAAPAELEPEPKAVPVIDDRPAKKKGGF